MYKYLIASFFEDIVLNFFKEKKPSLTDQIIKDKEDKEDNLRPKNPGVVFVIGSAPTFGFYDQYLKDSSNPILKLLELVKCLNYGWSEFSHEIDLMNLRLFIIYVTQRMANNIASLIQTRTRALPVASVDEVIEFVTQLQWLIQRVHRFPAFYSAKTDPLPLAELLLNLADFSNTVSIESCQNQLTLYCIAQLCRQSYQVGLLTRIGLARVIANLGSLADQQHLRGSKSLRSLLKEIDQEVNQLSSSELALCLNSLGKLSKNWSLPTRSVEIAFINKAVKKICITKKSVLTTILKVVSGIREITEHETVVDRGLLDLSTVLSGVLVCVREEKTDAKQLTALLSELNEVVYYVPVSSEKLQQQLFSVLCASLITLHTMLVTSAADWNDVSAMLLSVSECLRTHPVLYRYIRGSQLLLLVDQLLKLLSRVKPPRLLTQSWVRARVQALRSFGLIGGLATSASDQLATQVLSYFNQQGVQALLATKAGISLVRQAALYWYIKRSPIPQVMQTVIEASKPAPPPADSLQAKLVAEFKRKNCKASAEAVCGPFSLDVLVKIPVKTRTGQTYEINVLVEVDGLHHCDQEAWDEVRTHMLRFVQDIHHEKRIFLWDDSVKHVPSIVKAVIAEVNSRFYDWQPDGLELEFSLHEFIGQGGRFPVKAKAKHKETKETKELDRDVSLPVTIGSASDALSSGPSPTDTTITPPLSVETSIADAVEQLNETKLPQEEEKPSQTTPQQASRSFKSTFRTQKNRRRWHKQKDQRAELQEKAALVEEKKAELKPVTLLPEEQKPDDTETALMEEMIPHSAEDPIIIVGKQRSIDTSVCPSYLEQTHRGEAEAPYRLSIILQARGQKEEAWAFCQLAAERGYPVAQSTLGDAYSKGRHVKKDQSKAIYWYKLAIKAGWRDAQKSLGKIYEENKDTQQAVKWYRQAAMQGDRWAQYQLSIIYLEGEEKNPSEGFRWTWCAAEQEYSLAQYNLGCCYENGIGVSKDDTEALKWYQAAAKPRLYLGKTQQGCEDAQIRLWKWHSSGGIKPDPHQAFYWAKELARRGDAAAQHEVAYAYQEGKVVTKNLSTAFGWSQKAAKQGRIADQYNLGFCYYWGDGVDQNYKEAFTWYRAAAEKGCVNSQVYVGFMSLQEGLPGVSYDPDVARRYLALANQQGHTQSKRTLDLLKKAADSAKVVVTLDRDNRRFSSCIKPFSLDERKLTLVKKLALNNDSPKELERGLRKAAANNSPSLLSALLKSGVSPNASDEKAGKTPLHWAAEKGHFECVEILLKHGAITTKDASGRLPSDYTVDERILKLLPPTPEKSPASFSSSFH